MVFPATANARPYAQEAGTVAPDRNRFLEGQLAGQVVDSPEHAINVWDMERTTHANNLPEHWAFLHLGVDDFETRVANREGFNRLMLRPRRLGQDVSNLDTSIQMYGKRLDTPLFTCPILGPEGLSYAGRGWGGPGGSREGSPDDLVAREFTVVRRDRRGVGRAALVSALHKT